MFSRPLAGGTDQHDEHVRTWQDHRAQEFETQAWARIEARERREAHEWRGAEFLRPGPMSEFFGRKED